MNLDLTAIFGAGLLTFVSPCILPLVPVYLALLTGTSVGQVREGGGRGRLMATALAFGLGLTLVFVALGMAATVVGRGLLAHRGLLLQLGGLVVFLFGLKFLGVLRLPWLEREFRPGLDRIGQRGGLFGALLFGAAFGLGWTPCIGPVLGTVLTYTASTTARPATGALYLGTYAAGLVLPLLATAAVAPVALRWLQRARAHLRTLEIVTGTALALVGLLLMTDSLGALMVSFTPAPAPQQASATTTDTGAACDGDTDGGAATCGVPELAAGAEAPASDGTLPGGPALVEFVSPTCTVCERMAPLVAAVEHACAGHDVEVARVDVSAPGGRDLARRFGVLGVPTFVALDHSGREVSRLVGEQSRRRLEQSVQALSGRTCASEPAGGAPDGASS